MPKFDDEPIPASATDGWIIVISGAQNTLYKLEIGEGTLYRTVDWVNNQLTSALVFVPKA